MLNPNCRKCAIEWLLLVSLSGIRSATTPAPTAGAAIADITPVGLPGGKAKADTR